MSMIPPDFRPDGRRYKEQLEFDATWTQLRKEYGYETSKMKEEGNWDGYDECVERYREKLLEGEDEWINPPLNSTLLAKVGLGLGLGLGSGSGLGLALALALAPTQP